MIYTMIMYNVIIMIRIMYNDLMYIMYINMRSAVKNILRIFSNNFCIVAGVELSKLLTLKFF